MSDRRRRIVGLTTLPMQFPSLEHFVEAVEHAVTRAETTEGLSKVTTRHWRYVARRFTEFLQLTRSAQNFLGGDAQRQVRLLEMFIAHLRQHGANHTTVNHYWRSLHAVVQRVATTHEMVPITLAVATPRAGRPLPRFLTRDALDRILMFTANYQWIGGEFARLRNLAVIAVLGLCGLRRGELLRLRMCDVDLVGQRISVFDGKGRDGGKSRIVYLPDPVAACLARYATARQLRGASREHFFLSTAHDCGMHPTTLRRLFSVIESKTGVHVASHMLRHTAATLMRQAGVPDRVAMEQLGHASIVVLQRYSHVVDGEVAAEMQRLNAASTLESMLPLS
ncbi:MAG TPA: tyrosine-type recombinase/integrase [Thermoanaerobaculia bacterium]|nr:tyrosine-type recombinase/integrase [Thermoanaerobaculia bacterium]